MMLTAAMLLLLQAEPTLPTTLRLAEFQGVTPRVDDEATPWGTRSRSIWSLEEVDAVTRRVMVISIPPRAPHTLARYLAVWRSNHGCVAKQRDDLEPLRLNGKGPPQLVFSGHCKGGDVFISRVVIVGDEVITLHVETRHNSTRPTPRDAELTKMLRDWSKSAAPSE